MGLKNSKPIKEEDTGMLDEDPKTQKGKTRFQRLLSFRQIKKIAKINIPGDSNYFYGVRVVCMKSVKEFMVVYSSSYIVFPSNQKPRPTFLDYSLESPVYCNGHYYCVGRRQLMRVSTTNGDIKNLKLKLGGVNSYKKNISVSLDNKKHLVILNSNHFTLYDTETGDSVDMKLVSNPAPVAYKVLPDNRVIVLTNTPVERVNNTQKFLTRIAMFHYKPDFSEPEQNMSQLSTLKISKLGSGMMHLYSYANLGSLAYCRKNNLVSVTLLSRGENVGGRVAESRVSSIVFYKIKGRRLAIQTRYQFSGRFVPETICSLYTSSALKTSMLTLIMSSRGSNGPKGRILTIPYDSKNRKVLDLRIEDNPDIQFGTAAYADRFCRFGNKLFGIDSEKMFYFLSSD